MLLSVELTPLAQQVNQALNISPTPEHYKGLIPPLHRGRLRRPQTAAGLKHLTLLLYNYHKCPLFHVRQCQVSDLQKDSSVFTRVKTTFLVFTFFEVG